MNTTGLVLLNGFPTTPCISPNPSIMLMVFALTRLHHVKLFEFTNNHTFRFHVSWTVEFETDRVLYARCISQDDVLV